jgi:deoxyadenosine/deoxycytidine kinase
MKKLFFPEGTLLEVVGNVASGKTTLAKKLPKVTNLKYQDTDLFENNPFLIPSVENPKRWVFTEELYFYFLRSKRIPEVVSSLKKNPIILDQGFHMPSYMYTNNRLKQGHMTKEEWNFINGLFEVLTKEAPVPNAIIFLDVPIQELTRRMNGRGRKGKREHEKLYTGEYLKQLNIGLLEYISQMKKEGKSILTYDYKKNEIRAEGKKIPGLEKIIIEAIHS